MSIPLPSQAARRLSNIGILAYFFCLLDASDLFCKFCVSVSLVGLNKSGLVLSVQVLSSDLLLECGLELSGAGN